MVFAATVMRDAVFFGLLWLLLDLGRLWELFVWACEGEVEAARKEDIDRLLAEPPLTQSVR